MSAGGKDFGEGKKRGGEGKQFSVCEFSCRGRVCVWSKAGLWMQSRAVNAAPRF